MTTPDQILADDLSNALQIVAHVASAKARHIVRPGDSCEFQARIVVFSLLRQRGHSFKAIADAFLVTKGCVSKGITRLVGSEYGMRIFRDAQAMQSR